MIDKYCVVCHNERAKTAGLLLDRANPSRVSEDPDTWEKVVRKLRAGVMPPPGMPRPERAALERFAESLEKELDRSAKTDPGPSALRRLNRAEYAAAVHDLLGLDVDVSSMLPADDANFGFDNIANSMKVSPALLEAYLSASRKIARLAVGDREIAPAFSTYRVRPDFGQDQHIDGLPLGTRGGMAVTHDFPLDGEYVLKPKLEVNTSAKVRGLDFENEFILTIDGRRVHHATLGGAKDEDDAALSPPDSEAEILKRLEIRLWVPAGPHVVGATFVRKTDALADGLMQPFGRSNFDTQEQRGVPVVDSISIGGPFDATGAGDTPSRRKIFVCRPASASEDAACAKKILTALIRRAYRRPVESTDLDAAMHLFETGEHSAEGPRPFDAGIENAIRFVVSSPKFLFRAESDPPGAAPGSVHRVTDLELASRLSFFLWSTIPDDRLVNVAQRGRLKDPAGLEAQVRRMLADPKSKALVENFASQWLYLRNLRGVTRDLATFPDFDDNLRQGFRRETELFVESIIREDRSVLDFLRADYTFVNERLARQYGIPGVEGDYFRRVELTGNERRGLLGQGSILTVTSYATRTSPVLRGKWLLENIMGAPVPPPPPNVPPLDDNRAGAKPRSVRERMEQHRRSPSCGVCHNIMDPLGFSLENFDATGAWRVRSESRDPIDASGMLVDGTKVDGPVSLREALIAHPDTFVRTLTEKLLIYALGRGLESYDMPVIRSIVRDAARADDRFSALVLGIVRSAEFQMKRTDSSEEKLQAKGDDSSQGRP